MKRNGVGGRIPQWLPSRPLLLGYLIQRKIIGAGASFDDNLSRGAGWATLLSKISEREAEVNENLDSVVIQEIVERLATHAGKYNEGLGPITNKVIFETWRNISGDEPDTAAQQFLLRLPGIQPAEESGESRKFIDTDFAAAARAGDVVRLIKAPHSVDPLMWTNSYTELGDLGAEVAAEQLRRENIVGKRLRLALEEVSGIREYGCLGLSLARVANAANFDLLQPDLVVVEAIVDEWSLFNNIDLSGVVFRGCLVEKLLISPDWNATKGPRFENCEILSVTGRTSSLDLPGENFKACTFGQFAATMSTTAAIQAANLPAAVTVLLTIVEKLFFQPGRGRDETAFPRGLEPKLRPLVPDLLEILQSSGWAQAHRSGNKLIWRPDRSFTHRARNVISAPSTSADEILSRARKLS